MKKIIGYILSNYAVLLFAAVLFFPFFFAFSAYNYDIQKRLLINLLFVIIIYVILLVCQGKLRKIFSILVAVISYIPNLIVLSFLLMDNTVLKSTDFWVVFNSNPAEASNLFATLPYSVFVWSTIYTILLVLSVVLIFKRNYQKTLSLFVQVLAISFLIIISMVNPFRSKVPMIDFYKSFYNYQREMREVAEFYKQRQNMELDVNCALPESKKTILIVIGESQNRQHMQLYGYTRPTNPLLTEISNELVCYNNVCSPAIQTLPCMKQILTFANYERPYLYKEEANIIELLRSSGYKTFWYDNQGKSKNGVFAIDTYTPTSYRTMAKQSEVYDDSKSCARDSSMIAQLDIALQDTANSKVIFLHLIGNHFDYKNRYEQNFDVFKTSEEINSPFAASLSSKQLEVLNSYDNATLYNDYIVRTLIEMLRKQEGMSAMLYFSDHGEEIYDYQLYSGRSFEKISPAMCDIPLILWMNDTYRNLDNLYLEKDIPLCTDDIIYGIMDLAGIKYAMYESERSIFNQSYKPKERMVQGKTYQSIYMQFFSK